MTTEKVNTLVSLYEEFEITSRHICKILKNYLEEYKSMFTSFYLNGDKVCCDGYKYKFYLGESETEYVLCEFPSHLLTLNDEDIRIWAEDIKKIRDVEKRKKDLEKELELEERDKQEYERLKLKFG